MPSRALAMASPGLSPVSSASCGSTPPPGNTSMLGTNADAARRRSSSTCRSGRSSTIITVAAGRTGTWAGDTATATLGALPAVQDLVRLAHDPVDQLGTARQVFDQA